jgi:hypothetical protein
MHSIFLGIKVLMNMNLALWIGSECLADAMYIASGSGRGQGTKFSIVLNRKMAKY